MTKDEIKDLSALKYAESVKKVNKPIMDAWKNGFFHCDVTLGLRYQLKQCKEECQDYIDHWEERAGFSDVRGQQWAVLREKSNKAKEVIDSIQNLIEALDRYENKTI